MRILYAIPVVISLVFAGGYSVAADSGSFSTRYGTLAFGANGVLAFKGRPISPEVTYDKFAIETPVARFSVGTSDIFLFQQSKGNSCPGNFTFVTVTADGAHATKNFGTCYDDNTQPILSGDSISFSMPGIGGKGKSIFVYKAGVVTHNGRPIK